MSTMGDKVFDHLFQDVNSAKQEPGRNLDPTLRGDFRLSFYFDLYDDNYHLQLAKTCARRELSQGLRKLANSIEASCEEEK